MNRRHFVPTLVGIGISWLPYVTLRLYWQHHIAGVPGAARGELSGPTSFFLPLLLAAAILYSLFFLARLILSGARYN